MLKLQIDLYEDIKLDLETSIKDDISVNLGSVTALNAVNSALADLYKQLIESMKAS